MSDLLQSQLEQGIPKVEQPRVLKIAEPVREVSTLPPLEQKIVERIDKDGDEDRVLQDITRLDDSKKMISEASIANKEPNQENKPTRLPGYKRIFEGVYDQLRQSAYGKTPEEKGQRFIEGIAQKAQRHIGEIQSQKLTNQDIYQEIWGGMSAYIMQYKESSRFEEKKQEVSAVYSRLTGNINTLVKTGEVDPLTAKVFARYLESYKHIGGHHYNAIVSNNQELPQGILQQNAPEYAKAVGNLIRDFGDDAKEQESGGFVHFNADKQTSEVTTRIYINPDLAQAPDKILNAWHNTLVQTGLKDKIYFKVPTGLSKRQEGIVVYLTDQTKSEDVENLLTTFADICPQELLAATPMPSAVPISRGIAMAPELKNINTFIKYSGLEEKISYNEWVASSIQLAFELSYYEAIEKGASNITPKTLKESAGDYFEKIVKLSGINPETMVPNSLGGKLPSWSTKIAS